MTLIASTVCRGPLPGMGEMVSGETRQSLHRLVKVLEESPYCDRAWDKAEKLIHAQAVERFGSDVGQKMVALLSGKEIALLAGWKKSLALGADSAGRMTCCLAELAIVFVCLKIAKGVDVSDFNHILLNIKKLSLNQMRGEIGALACSILRQVCPSIKGGSDFDEIAKQGKKHLAGVALTVVALATLGILLDRHISKIV